MKHLDDDVTSMVFSFLGLEAPAWRGVAHRWKQLIDAQCVRLCLLYQKNTDKTGSRLMDIVYGSDESSLWLSVHVCCRMPRMMPSEIAELRRYLIEFDHSGYGRIDAVRTLLNKANNLIAYDVLVKAGRGKRLENLSLDLTYTKSNPVLIAGVTPALRSVCLRLITLPNNAGVGAAVGEALRFRATQPTANPIRLFDLRTQVSSASGADDAAKIVEAVMAAGISTVNVRWRNNAVHAMNITSYLTRALTLCTAAPNLGCERLTVTVEGLYMPHELGELLEAAALCSQTLIFKWNAMHHLRILYDWDIWAGWWRPANQLCTLHLDLVAMHLSAKTFESLLHGALSGEWLPILEEFHFDARFNMRIRSTAFPNSFHSAACTPPPLRVLRMRLTTNNELGADKVDAWVIALQEYFKGSSGKELLDATMHGSQSQNFTNNMNEQTKKMESVNNRGTNAFRTGDASDVFSPTK